MKGAVFGVAKEGVDSFEEAGSPWFHLLLEKGFLRNCADAEEQRGCAAFLWFSV
ncbi:hypothetical protein ABVT39_027032 [Epinephelus coioides]